MNSTPSLNLKFCWHVLLVLGLLMLLALLFMLLLVTGSVEIPYADIFGILIGETSQKEVWQQIVNHLRLPKALTAILAGAALAVSGLQMQTLFRNPLADSYVLGISAGASLGVALVVMGSGPEQSFIPQFQSFSQYGMVFAGVCGAGLVVGLILIMSQRVENTVNLLILGLMLGSIVSGVVSILVYFSRPEQIQLFFIWMFGSFRGVSQDQVWVLGAVTLVGLLMSLISVKSLNALLLGRNYAMSMGVSVKMAQTLIITSTSLMTGAVTVFCGPIGFFGIVVPHLCRGLFHTSDHRILVPMVALVGSIMALLAEFVAQLPGTENPLPITAITSLVGAPLVMWVIFYRSSGKEF